MSDADININGEAGTMTIRVPLRGDRDLTKNKIFAYGVLKLAEDMMSRYFITEEMKMHQMKEKLGLIKPGAAGPN